MKSLSAVRSSDELTQLAYDALDRPSAWQELLDGIVASTHRTQGLLSIVYPGQPIYSFQVTSGASPEALREYVDRWLGHDIWATRVDPFSVPVGKLVLSHEICSDEILESSDYYRKFLSRYRWHYGGAVRLSGQSHQMAALSIVGPKDHGPLNDRHVALLNRIIPHLCRAIRVHEAMAELRQQNAAAVQSASRPDDGVVLTTARGHLLYSNPAADRILARADGVRLRGASLAACDPEDQHRLHAAIRLAAEDPGRASAVPVRLPIRRQSGGLPYLILVQPASPADPTPMSLMQPTTLVTLIDPTRSSASIDIEALRQVFHLSIAEARLVEQLVSGLTPKGAAQASCVSISTIRTQLRNVFAKTGCSRQSELVKLALRMADRRG